MVIKLEIKPTKMTTHILTTVINEKPQAYAYLMGDRISGTVCFYPYNKGTIMIYEINGLPKDKGFLGFHIHEGNSCNEKGNEQFGESLGHYNPTNQKHPNHLGDLPPLFETKSVAWGIVYIDKFKPKDIIDRTLIIHDYADDFHSQPSGNSGQKIACGIIKIWN